jgi:hypothetical protein
MDLQRHNRFFTVASVFAALVLQPLSVFGDDPGNVPPDDPDCTPNTYPRWDPIDPSYGTHQVPQETNRTYCADGSLARIYGDIYHYQLFKEFEVTDYPSDSSCPADSEVATNRVEPGGGYIRVDRDVELPGSPGINGSVCGGSGDDDDDSGGGDDDGGGGTSTDCYTLSESSRDVTADNFCNKYYTPRVYDDEAVTELPDKNGLNILYEVVYEWIPRRGFTSIDYERPDSPEDYLTYNTRTYTREISSGCVEGNGSGQSKYEYKPASWDYCGTFSGYSHRIPTNGVFQEGLSGQAPDGLSQWTVYKHSYGADKSFNVKYTTTYLDPYTSSAFRSDAVSAAPAFSNVFSRATTSIGNISASLNLTHSHLYYRKVKFKFKWGNEVDPEDRYPVKYLVLFTPESDGNPDNGDESEEVELITSVPVEWDGESGESGSFIIDPGAINATKDGAYRLIQVGLSANEGAGGPYFTEDIRIDSVMLNSPQYFNAIADDDINPCDRQREDPALVVFYEDAVDENYSVKDFNVSLSAGSYGQINVFQWSKFKGPNSGVLTDTNQAIAHYSNPKVGGLYQFDVDIGIQSIRTSLLLPLAGADITDWLEAEAAAIGPWARSHLRATEDANYSDTPFVTRYNVFRTFALISGAFFDYTLDPVDANELSPCRRYQSTIRRGGEYGYVTFSGVVVHGSKINLALWSLFGNHWGYSQYHLASGGHINSILTGRGLDPVSSTEAIGLGSQLYLFPNTSMNSSGRINHLRRMQSDDDLIEEKLWPSPYPMNTSKSNMSRPDPDLPTTPN